MTYISLTDANAWIAGHIKSADRTAWDALQDADKTIVLQQAEDAIDALTLRGWRYEEKYIYNGSQKDVNADGLTQINEFPRYIDGVVCDWDHGTSRPIVPDDVKHAVCYEAVASCQAGTRKTMQSQGVQSFSIGKGQLAETFRPGAGQESLISDKARRLMKKYMGVEIR